MQENIKFTAADIAQFISEIPPRVDEYFVGIVEQEFLGVKFIYFQVTNRYGEVCFSCKTPKEALDWIAPRGRLSLKTLPAAPPPVITVSAAP